jgi:hypothetical protein
MRSWPASNGFAYESPVQDTRRNSDPALGVIEEKVWAVDVWEVRDLEYRHPR